jgi:Protein of unknown function (DUF4239)
MRRLRLEQDSCPDAFERGRTGLLTTVQSVFLGAAIVMASLSFLIVLNRFWPNEVRRRHNDLVGWQVGVVGTTYAVIIGFMLYAVWNDFEVARANVDAEANALVNISRLAAGLPQDQRENVQTIARRYADVMVNQEWDVMNRASKAPLESQALTRSLWEAVVRKQQLDPVGATILNYTVQELAQLTEHRRLRQLQSQTGLPGILWTVLIVGAVVTITSSCLFGTRSFPLHFLQVLGLSVLVALTLIAVGDIARPFQGSVHVGPEAFVHAQEVLSMEAEQR